MIVRRHLDDGAAMSPQRRRRLKAELSYDLYHRESGARPSFFRALLRNPGWLRVGKVRERLRAACAGRFFQRKRLPPDR